MKTKRTELNVSEEKLREMIDKTGFRCNAEARKAIADKVRVTVPRDLPVNWQILVETAEQIGGCKPGDKYEYPTPTGTATARVTGLYDIPTSLTNPFLVCFSGFINAWMYTAEIVRWHAKQTGNLLPLLSIGKGGNKGLFESVYNRSKGLVTGSECEAYLNILSQIMPESYVRKYQQKFADMDTAGNLRELYRFAKEQKLTEVSFILCTGQPWYDKRVLAEWMWMLKSDEFTDIKINLILAHCPVWLGSATPEGHPSEILMGYIAASLGPLTKDVVRHDGTTESQHPERYLMPGVSSAPWWLMRPVICQYGNMGWPDYEELLYGTPHKEAVEHIITADLYARASFTPASYDDGVMADIAAYRNSTGEFWGENEEEFLEWCKDSPEEKFF